MGLPGGSVVNSPSAVEETQETWVRSLGGKILWRRQWLPLQDSCLENPMDRGGWWVTVHGVTKGRIGLGWTHECLSVTRHKQASSARAEEQLLGTAPTY